MLTLPFAFLLGTTGPSFGTLGLLAAVHPAVVVAVGAATCPVLLMLTLLVLAMMLLALSMLPVLAMSRARLLVLLVLIMTLVLGRRGLRRRGGSQHERNRHGEILHRHSPDLLDPKIKSSGESRRRRFRLQVDARKSAHGLSQRYRDFEFGGVDRRSGGRSQGRAGDHAVDRRLVGLTVGGGRHVLAMARYRTG